MRIATLVIAGLIAVSPALAGCTGTTEGSKDSGSANGTIPSVSTPAPTDPVKAPATSPMITLGSLMVPAEVPADTPFEVRLTVHNAGSAAENVTVELQVDGAVAAVAHVTVPARGGAEVAKSITLPRGVHALVAAVPGLDTRTERATITARLPAHIEVRAVEGVADQVEYLDTIQTAFTIGNSGDVTKDGSIAIQVKHAPSGAVTTLSDGRYLLGPGETHTLTPLWGITSRAPLRVTVEIDGLVAWTKDVEVIAPAWGKVEWDLVDGGCTEALPVTARVTNTGTAIGRNVSLSASLHWYDATGVESEDQIQGLTLPPGETYSARFLLEGPDRCDAEDHFKVHLVVTAQNGSPEVVWSPMATT